MKKNHRSLFHTTTSQRVLLDVEKYKGARALYGTLIEILGLQMFQPQRVVRGCYTG